MYRKWMQKAYLPEHAMLVANNTFCFFFFLRELVPSSPEMSFNSMWAIQQHPHHLTGYCTQTGQEAHPAF